MKTPPDHEADAEHHNHGAGRHDEVSQGTSHQDCAGSHGKGAEAVDDALLQVLGHVHPGKDRPEHDRLTEDTGHQELRVVAALDVHDTAVDLREQHDEHDRLYDGEGDNRGGASQLQQIAHQDGSDITQPPCEGSTFRGMDRVHAATSCSSIAWPVRVRKTSSRVGRRMPASCNSMPASFRAVSTEIRAADGSSA